MSDLPQIIDILHQDIRINEMEMELQDLRVKLALANGKVFLSVYDEEERGYNEIKQLVEMLEIVQADNINLKEDLNEVMGT